MRDRQCALNHDAIEPASIVSSVINKPLSCVYYLSTDDLLWRNFLSPHVEIAHVTLTTPTYGALTHHKTKTSHGQPVYEI